MATELNGYYGEMGFSQVCEKVRDLCIYEINMAAQFGLPESPDLMRHKDNAGEAERVYLAAMAKAERRIKRIRERAALVAARAMRQRGLGNFADAIEEGNYTELVF